MPFFTVFTPTYNRGYILPQLYQSLQNQSDYDFEWMIVDDGSSDHTEDLVKGWMKEDNPFSVSYIKKENGGKPRAINLGLEKACGEYFFIVDSDDYLTPDAISKMHQWCQEICSIPNLIGVGAARGYPDGSYIKGVAPAIHSNGYIDAANLERKYYNLDADMCEAYKTELFRNFPMAEWPGEKFAPEQIAMNSMSLAGYKVRWHADIIYICEYLPDGLTQGSGLLEKRNPMGYAMMYNHMLLYPTLTGKQKFHAACQHIALSIVGGHPAYLLKSNRLRYTLAALPLGLVLSVRRRKQFRNMESKTSKE